MFCRASAANSQLAACRILMWLCWIFSHCVRLTWFGPRRNDLRKYFQTVMHHLLAISSSRIRRVMKTDYLCYMKNWYFGYVTSNVVADWLIDELRILEARTSLPCPENWYFKKLRTSVRPFVLAVCYIRIITNLVKPNMNTMPLELIPHWYSQVSCFTSTNMVIMRVYEFRETFVLMLIGPASLW